MLNQGYALLVVSNIFSVLMPLGEYSFPLVERQHSLDFPPASSAWLFNFIPLNRKKILYSSAFCSSGSSLCELISHLFVICLLFCGTNHTSGAVTHIGLVFWKCGHTFCICLKRTDALWYWMVTIGFLGYRKSFVKATFQNSLFDVLSGD